jgi:hypothetical protein
LTARLAFPASRNATPYLDLETKNVDAVSRTAAFDVNDPKTWSPEQRERHWNPFLRHSELSLLERATSIPDLMTGVLAEALPAEDFHQLPEPEELPPDVSPPVSDAMFVLHMPGEYRERLAQLPRDQRVKRLAAIRERVSPAELGLLMTHPVALSALANALAEEVARTQDQEAGDDNELTPDQLRLRSPTTWNRRLRKRSQEVDWYLAAATGAVGKRIGTPFASAFTLARFIERQKQSLEIMSGLRLVRKDKPSVQMKAVEVAERAATARQAKIRLLLDAEEYRGRAENLTLAWITITLPGEFVPRAKHEEKRTSTWDPDLDFLAGDREIQKRWTQIRASAAKRKLRISGVWASQLQENGVQHRHLALWFHSVDEARTFCDLVRDKFPGEHGCKAYVIGDEHPSYRPPVRQDTKEAETVGSVFRYLARYALRAAFLTDGDDKRTRHAAGTAGRVRSFAFLGTKAGASQIWDTLWAAMEREQFGHKDERIAAAIMHLVEAQAWSRTAAEARRVRDQEDFQAAYDREMGDLEDFGEASDTTDQDDDHGQQVREAQDAAARSAYHACLLMGRWAAPTPDEDQLVEDQAGTSSRPKRVWVDRLTRFGDVRRDFVGIQSGDEPEGEVVRLHAHEWALVDVEHAEAMAVEAARMSSDSQRRLAAPRKEMPEVTDNLTCPRVAPTGLPTALVVKADHPPGGPPRSIQAV